MTFQNGQWGKRGTILPFDYRFHTDNYNYAKEIDQSGNNYTIICSIWNDPLCKQPLVAKGKTKDTATPYYFITRNVVKLLADKFYLKFPVNDLSNNLTEMYGGNYVGGKNFITKYKSSKKELGIGRKASSSSLI